MHAHRTFTGESLILIYFTSTTKRSMSLLEFTTTMDSNNEEPPAKRYRYSSERHPFRIFEDFDFDGLNDDEDEDDDSLFAEVSRTSNFTVDRPADANAASATSAERRHPSRKARRDEHQQQQASPATAPRRVSVASMDDEDMADDNIAHSQEHNDGTTNATTTYVTTTTTASTTSTTLPRNVSLHLFELATSASTKQNNTKNAGDASLPSLAHSSASSVTHLHEMAEEDRMVLEE